MLRLTTLGALLLTGPGGAHAGPLARARIRALLALLARSGAAGVSRDRLCALLWPESPPDRARHSLDQALYLVRKELGAAMGPSPDPVVLAAAALPSDVAEFTTALADGRFEEAATHYGGPFLDGFHLSGAPEFERWVDAERAALHRQHAQALERAAGAADSRGDTGVALVYWRRLAAVEPYSSRVVLGLMHALVQAGEPGSALDAARVHELLLAQELDAVPDPAVAALAARLRQEPRGAAAATQRHEPRGAAAAAQPMTTSSPAPTASSASAAGGGRNRESGHAIRSSTRSAPASAPLRPRIRHRWHIPALLAAGMVGAVLMAFVLGDGRSGALTPPAVAVLPFTNETGDPALEPVGPSASDWIAQGLIRTGLVRVADSGAALPLAAEVLGRVYRSRDTVWLQARIIRPGSREVAAVLDPVAAPDSDPNVALEAVRRQVLGALGVMFDPRLTAWSETALRPPAFEAYRAFAAGLEDYSAGSLEAALTAFAEAAATDLEYAQPRLWAVWTNIQLQRWAAADSILEALRPRATDLSPLDRAWFDRLDAHVRGDHERSFQAARRMVEIAPRSGWTIALVNTALDTRRPAVARAALLGTTPEAFGLEGPGYWSLLAWTDHALGEHRRELEAADAGIRASGRTWVNLMARMRALAALGLPEALEEDLADLVASAPEGMPDPVSILAIAGMELRAHGHYEAAERVLARAVGWYDHPQTGMRPDPARFARLLYELGDDARVDSVARTMLADSADPGAAPGLLGLLAARRGDRAEAQLWAGELARIQRPHTFGDRTLWRAQIAAALGDRDDAIELLRQAAAEGLDRFGWLSVHLFSEFDALRHEPAFRRLLVQR